MTSGEAVQMVWDWAAPIVGFLGFGAVLLLGFSLLRRI